MSAGALEGAGSKQAYQRPCLQLPAPGSKPALLQSPSWLPQAVLD